MRNCNKLFHGIHNQVIVIYIYIWATNYIYIHAVIKDREPVADQASRISSDGSGIVGDIYIYMWQGPFGIM